MIYSLGGQTGLSRGESGFLWQVTHQWPTRCRSLIADLFGVGVSCQTNLCTAKEAVDFTHMRMERWISPLAHGWDFGLLARFSSFSHFYRFPSQEQTQGEGCVIESALALFVYLPSCMFVCLSFCIVLFGFSAKDIHGCIIVVEEAVSAQLTNAFILFLLSPCIC